MGEKNRGNEEEDQFRRAPRNVGMRRKKGESEKPGEKKG